VLRSTAVVRRLLVLVAAVVPAMICASVLVANPAAADPGDEGGSQSLREQLDAASRGYIDAKAKLEYSLKRQKELTVELGVVEAELSSRMSGIGELVADAYRVGPLAPMSALLGADSTDAFLDGVAYIDVMAGNENRQIRDLTVARERVTNARTAIETALAEQRTAMTTMSQRKLQAERALLAVGGQATGGFVSASSPLARAAPRNPDGSWPTERCTVNDPTTSGCITPRLLHAYNETKRAGFNHYVSCYRSGGSGEHPKGRACDWAAAKDGFRGVATGADRVYGNNLAAFYIRNASRLGVLYVIWYRQIWIPSSGWRAYNGGGDPSSDHTNHVHLSVY